MPTARFQPYTIALFDPRSTGEFATRHLLTFRSRRSRHRWIHFVRHKCYARRRGSWVSIPGYTFFTRAIDYAARHGSYVYDLPVRKTPGLHRPDKLPEGEEDDFMEPDSDVGEEDIVSDAEYLSDH